MTPSRGRLMDRSILVVEALVGIGVVAAIVSKSYGVSPTLAFIACGVAAAFSGYVIVKMVSSLRDDTLEVTGRVEDQERGALEHEKLLLLQGIKELEADAAVGKVDAADYAHLRETAESRALEIIHRLKETDQRWRNEAERFVIQKLGRAVGPVREGAVAPPPPVEDPAQYREESAAQRRSRRAYSKLFDDRPVEMRIAAQAKRAVSEANGDGSEGSARAGPVAGSIACAGCDTANEEDARFCIGCGRPRKDVRSAPVESAEGIA